MGDDFRLCDMLQIIKKNKKMTLQKRKPQAPDHPKLPNSPFSPDQLDLQVINGLLDLQATPETTNLHSSTTDYPAQQENGASYKGETAPKEPLVSIASNPNNKRKCKQNSVSTISGKPPAAGRNRGSGKIRQDVKKHINANDRQETGGLRQFAEPGKEGAGPNSVQDNSIELHCQQDESLKEIASQENYVSSQKEHNDVTKIASKDPLILSTFDPTHKGGNKRKVKSTSFGNSQLHFGSKCACHKIIQDKRNHGDGKPSIGIVRLEGGKQSVGAIRHEDQGEICTNSLNENSTDLHCQPNNFLKSLEVFASNANILQDTGKDQENNSQDIRKCILLDEEKRELIAREMVKCCQNNSKMRNTFLESLNVLVGSGLLHSVASKVLSQGPCEEAQELLNILDKRSIEPDSAHSLNVLFHAVEKLHKAGGTFKSVSHLQDSNLFALSFNLHINHQCSIAHLVRTARTSQALASEKNPG